MTKKGSSTNKTFNSPGLSGSPISTVAGMTRRGSNIGRRDGVAACNVDKRLLDSLIQSLHVLRGDLDDEGQAVGGVGDSDATVDPSDLNSILHHLLSAVNDLTRSVQMSRRQCQDLIKTHKEVVPALEARMRVTEDEMDECRQRSLKGNFIITSVANDARQKVSLLKTDEQLREDGESLTDHVLDLAKRKYDVTINDNEIQACHRLPNNRVILRLWKTSHGSSWHRLVDKIKSGVNSGFNVYFNFHLSRRRNNLMYEIRKLKMAGKLHKFFVDENGQISVRIGETDGKRRVTYFSVGRGGDPLTLSIQELHELVNV